MLFYRRIFSTGHKKLIDLCVWIIIALLVVEGIMYCFGFIFICNTHLDYLWMTLQDEFRCEDITRVDLGLSTSNMIMDMIMMLFPIPLVRVFRYSKRRKGLTAQIDPESAHFKTPQGCHNVHIHGWILVRNTTWLNLNAH